MSELVTLSSKWATVRGVATATVTPLASILGSGLLIIVPILELVLGAFAVFGAIGICGFAWLVGTAIRHNVIVVGQQKKDGTLNAKTWRLGRLGDAVIAIAAAVPTFTLVTIASRSFAAYYAVEATIAFRTSSGFFRKSGLAGLALILLGITIFAQPAN